jgi:hypothetical protein
VAVARGWLEMDVSRVWMFEQERIVGRFMIMTRPLSRKKEPCPWSLKSLLVATRAGTKICEGEGEIEGQLRIPKPRHRGQCGAFHLDLDPYY